MRAPALRGTPADRSYATRRRIAGANTAFHFRRVRRNHRRPLGGAFWSVTVDELNAAEIGAVKSGGADGTGLRVQDAWLSCEYQ